MTPRELRNLDAGASGSRGFTLIEVLVGLALLALVVSIIQGVYTGVVRSREHLQAEVEGAHAAAILLQRMSDELAATWVSDSEERRSSTQFLVSAEANGSSRIEFTAPLPEYLQAGPGQAVSGGGLSRIAYFLEKQADGTWSLARQESREEGGDLSRAPEPDPILRDAVRFRVLCSLDGKEWKETWDSANRDAGEALPKEVSLEITWTQPGRGTRSERVLRTSIPLYRAIG